MQQVLITKSTLKKRGWTEALIARFLAEPDKECDNPHYKCDPPMKLYRLKRVGRAEASVRFKALQPIIKGRKAAAAKAVLTKIERLRQYVATVVIVVPERSREELLLVGRKHFNNRLDDQWAA